MDTYEKKYKEALELARDYYKANLKLHKADENLVLEDIFPELKESEDELTWLTKYIEEEAYSLSIDIRDNEDRIKLKNLQRSLAWLKRQENKKSFGLKEEENIREGIIKSINDLNTEWLELHGVTKVDALAWLEKQGEQNPTTLDDADIRKEITDFICKVTDTSSMSLEEVEKSNKWLEWLNTPQNKQEWSERDAIEALRTEYEKGRHDMREEMIKDAVDAVISQVPGINEIVFYNPASTSRYKYDLPTEMNNLGLNKGDKVKLIIIKDN